MEEDRGDEVEEGGDGEPRERLREAGAVDSQSPATKRAEEAEGELAGRCTHRVRLR